MFSHDKEPCKEIENEILDIVKQASRPLSLEEIRCEINRRHNPPHRFYEIFHHTYHLVDKGKLIVAADGPRQTYLFTATR